MLRRDLLKSLCLLPLAGMTSRVWAAPNAGESRFLLVFLRGGYDAAHLLVPYSSDFYYTARPTLAIGKPASGAQCALALDGDWGLHPALETSLLPLYQVRQLAFVPFAGTDDLTRSHFETQDSIEMGQPLGGRRDYNSGFLNRLAAQLGAVPAMAFTDQLPLCMRGSVQIPNMALRQANRPGIDVRERGIIQTMYQGHALGPQVQQGFEVRDSVLNTVLDGMDASAGRNAISAKGFELEARRIALLMKDQVRLGFLDVGGWDTHVNQGGANGYLAGRFDELGRGLAAFAEEIGPAWQNTVIVVLSEFGRTLRENGNHGTDHGHGSVHWVLGGKLAGGRVVGEQVTVSQATLLQNRDYPVLNDYRAVLGGLFARLYGLSPSQLQRIFPNVAPVDLGLV